MKWVRCFTQSSFTHTFIPPTDFHSSCDNKGPSITLVERDGLLLGGYTSVSWNETMGEVYDPYAFVFRNNEATPITRVATNPTIGPRFVGHMTIYDDVNIHKPGTCDSTEWCGNFLFQHNEVEVWVYGEGDHILHDDDTIRVTQGNTINYIKPRSNPCPDAFPNMKQGNNGWICSI